MKKISVYILLFCAISSSAAGQGNFLKRVKRGLDKVEEASKSDAATVVQEIITTISDNSNRNTVAAGVQASGQPFFVYPEAGAWKMTFVSCEGNSATGEVKLHIKALPLRQSPGTDVNCYLLEATDLKGSKVDVGPWGSANRYDLPAGSATQVEFQPMVNVAGAVDTVSVKFIVGIEIPNNTFELRNVPVNWISPGEEITAEAGGVTTGTVMRDKVGTTTEIIPGRTEIEIAQGPGRIDRTTTVTEGFDTLLLRTSYFYFDDPASEFEVADTDLFDPEMLVYSMTVALRDSRFPAERAYQHFGDVYEDLRTKDYYMKHMAKCYVFAERGKTSDAERELITENYLYLTINKFVNDNADNFGNVGTLDVVGGRLISRRKLIESRFGINLATDPEITQALDDGERHVLEYIAAHPPQKNTFATPWDSEAVRYNFEYKFYDKEMAIHAFFFSPITLHYEMWSFYDKHHDMTVFAYFYCVGYDNPGMKQALGADTYRSVKEDFKTRSDLDFDKYPLQCLMATFEKTFVTLSEAPVVEKSKRYLPGPLSLKISETPPQKKTTKTNTPEPVTVVKPNPPTFTVSPNSAAWISGINIIDIAEDTWYTYIAGAVAGSSKIFAIEKSSGKITEIYTTTHGNKGDKGDVKNMMQGADSKVLVQFTKHTIMTLENCAFEDTNIKFADKWSSYYPKLKAVMPSGDVLMIANHMGNQNLLVDRNTGEVKMSTKTMSFNDNRGQTAVTPDGVVWEQGSGSYNRVSGIGAGQEPTVTKFNTGSDSPFKGTVNEIKTGPNGDLYIASRYGLHKSTDNGQIWKHIPSTYAYGSFERLAPSGADVWTSIGTTGGYSVVKYDATLSKVLFQTLELDVMKDGKKVKLDTKPYLMFVDSAGNLWMAGGTYGPPTLYILNPTGIMGYSDIAAKKTVSVQ